MSARVLKEVRLVLPMKPDIEIPASEEASSFAASVSMSPDKIDELRMAVLEACINAYEHSQAPDRRIYVTLSAIGEERPESVQVEVKDTGVGINREVLTRSPGRKAVNAPRKRGWGLSIIRGLMDDVEIDSGGDGTTVVMSKRL